MFSDNGRISQRQLGRQVVLAFLGLFLLLAPINPQMRGRVGVISCILGTAAIFIYLFFLVRFAGAYRNPEKTLGKAASKIVAFIYLIYLILTGAFAVRVISDIIALYLLPGFDIWPIAALVVLISGWGTGWDLQRRSRLAEVTYPVIMGGFVLLLLFAAFQAPAISLEQSTRLPLEEVLQGSYQYFAAFSAVALTPFIMDQVQRSAGAGKRLGKSVGYIAIMTIVCLLIIQATFGYEGAAFRKIPILDIMSGVNLPGKFLERFDIIWISLLVFCLLFSIGSVLFYMNYILERVSLPGYRIVVAAAVFLTACLEYEGVSILSIYKNIMLYVYTPLLIVLSVCMGFMQRRKA